MIKISKPGIYDVPEDVYHGEPCVLPSLSSSGARTIIQKNAKKFWYERQHGTRKTPGLKFGTAAHVHLLENDRFHSLYHVLPEGYNKGHTVKQAEWIAAADEAEAAGKTLIKQEDYLTIQGMSAALEADAGTLEKFISAPTEQSGFWIDDTFQVWRRVRFDFLPREGRLFADFKTCESLNREDLSKAIHNYGYHQQADWYTAGARALGIHEAPQMLFIFQEKEPPYEYVIRFLDDIAMGYGKRMNAKALDLFAQGIETGHWPGYDETIEEISLPYWAEMRIQDQQDRGAFALSHRIQKPFIDAAE